MASPKVRRLPHLLGALAVSLAVHGGARAGKNDLKLFNLCPPSTAAGSTGGCSWVRTNASGAITGVDFNAAMDSDAASRYRSLMSELGVVVAPRLMTPADTLGYAGFQFSAELGVTKIHNDARYWDGVAGVTPSNPMAQRADPYLTTVGGYVRKGLWFPLPAFEFGAGAVSILGSNMYAVQGYAKLALQEGFHGWWLPSFAVRAGASQLLGTDQVDLTVYSFDALISKAFSIGGTARIEPFLGWSMLLIDPRSRVIDYTPTCDAYTQGAGCAPLDINANYAFPSQDIITRQRWVGGFKLKLSVLFVAAELDIALPGTSHDTSQPMGAADQSETQETYSLSAGLDF
jgi:hypothetical protein